MSRAISMTKGSNVALHTKGILKGIAAATASLALLAGCAPGQSDDQEAAKEDKDKNLSYVYFTDGPDEQATRDLIKKFEEKSGAKVDLQIVPFSDLEQTLQQRISGDNAPDVARIDKLASFSDDLLDLNQYQKEAFDGTFNPGMDLAAMSSDARIAAPNDLTLNGPIVNVELFKKAGVEVPTADKPWKSWDEMMEAAKKVQKAAGTENAVAVDVSGNRFSTVFSQFGTSAITKDGKNGWDEAKLTKALTKLNEWHQDGSMPKDLFLQAGSKYKAANEIFLAGQVPVYLSGNWQVAAFAKDATFDWAVVPNPCEDRCGGFPGGKFLVSFKGAKNPNLAAEFIAFMSEADQQKYMAEKANFMPTRQDLLEGDVKYAQRQEDMEVFQKGVTETPEDAFSSAFSPAFPNTTKGIIDEMAKMIDGQASPEDTAKAIIKATDESIANVS